ncbi:MAG: branched-chain amino acid ABC transporter permease [Micrococcales bacterium]|nr:branched-chain amino acid ABC transporter permease [Micrococcales bacterium]
MTSRTRRPGTSRSTSTATTTTTPGRARSRADRRCGARTHPGPAVRRPSALSPGGPSVRSRRTLRPALLLFGLVLAGALSLLGVETATAVTTAGPAATTTIEVNCLPGPTNGCIRGTLRDAAGAAVAKAKIGVTGPDGTTVTATTNKAGQFGFSLETAGSYTVKLDTSTLPRGLKVAEPQFSAEIPFQSLRAAVFRVTGSQGGDTAAATSGLGARVFQQAASGLRLGLLLALASIGLSLVYGTTGLANFAHAEQVTLGGILAYVFTRLVGVPLLGAIAIAVAICALTGWLQDRFIWAPLRRKGLGVSQLMIVTIGLSLALEYVFQYFIGGGTVQITTSIQRNVGPLTIPSYISMAIAVVVLVVVGCVLLFTRIGKATRAVSDNRALAAASGIDVDRIIRLVWIAGTGLAGLGGILYAIVQNGIKWDTGLQILLMMFAAVTLGGLGTAFGALLGSLIIGLVVELSNLILPSDLKYATALFILIVILVFRPQGILGRRSRVG